ncbi:HprK-related kinase A [Motiliproteus sp.]|uniref:HprK-related kinase A n=1 Tax=Motiliproteus sp. TaxID=1898955 RepID=UPI003BAA205E
MGSNEFQFLAGRYRISLHTNIPKLSSWIEQLYNPEPDSPWDFADFHVRVSRYRGLDTLFQKQAKFTFAERTFFNPLEYDHAFPLLEWGLNWCVTNHINTFIVIHGAVLERNGCALVMPGNPGSGKSTLCAALSFRKQWRLLSDELTLYDANTNQITPNPRPIALKDGSIDVVGRFHPRLSFTEQIHDTHKGSISYLLPESESLKRRMDNAEPSVLLFPRYDREADGCSLMPIDRAVAMMRLAEQTFNYSILGQTAFTGLNRFVRNSRCFELHYNGDLELACQAIEELF